MYVVFLLFYAIGGFFVCCYVDFVILFSSAPLFLQKQEIIILRAYTILLLSSNDRLYPVRHGG